MLARIVDDKIIQIEQITPPEEDAIIKAFSVKSPKARFIDTTMGNFDGWYRKYNSKHKTIDRALLGELRKVCNDRQLPLHIVDMRSPPRYPAPDPSVVTTDFLPGITLEPYQVSGIQSPCRAEVGLIQAPTGSGKGEMIAGVAKLFNCPTVIIAEQKVVVTQLKERLELRKVVEEAGLFIAGKRPNGQMVIIGSIAALMIPKEPEKTQKDTPEKYARKLKAWNTRRKNARVLRDLVGKCDLLLIDEADRATNKQYRFLCKYWFKGRRKYGFSGTFFDPATPVQNLNLKENLGSIISYTPPDVVLAAGRTIPFTYTAIAFGDPKNRHDKSAHDIAVKEHMIENPTYHKLIVGLAENSVKQENYGTLIILESIPLGLTLEQMLNDRGVPTKFIYGQTSDKQRNEAIERFEKREMRVLIGSNILKRGLDLDGGCETLIIARDDQRWSEFMQIVGRAVRKNKLGKSKIFDIYFLCNQYLYDHSRSRIRHVAQSGADARIIFKTGIVSAEALIKSRFRIPNAKK